MEIQNFLKFEDVVFEKLSPVLKQYYEFKLRYKDYIVFFNIGGFYETYFEDAKKLSDAASIVLTKKNFSGVGNIILAGVPTKSIKQYVKKLLDENYKVVLIEQQGESKDEKGLVERKVGKIYTKGTLFETEFLNFEENNYIASIAENKEGFDFSYADISIGKIYKTNGNINEIMVELARIQPKELLLRKLTNIDKKIYEAMKYEKLNESFYEGEDENLAYRALINYSREILKEFIPKFEKAENYSICDYLQIDFLTRKNLELIKNSLNDRKYGSLLWAVDRCKTPMGKRLLSSFIQSPITDKEKIQERLNIIEKLAKNTSLVKKLESILENTGDILRITSKLSNETITTIEFLTLKEGFLHLKEIEKIINELNSPIFQYEFEKETLSDFYEILENTIEDDLETIKKGKYIKNGANSELDLLFDEFQNIKNEIVKYEKGLVDYLKIPELKIINKSASFYIEIPNSKNSLSVSDFRLIGEYKKTSRYTSGKLIQLEESYYETLSKIEEKQKYIFSNFKKYSKELTFDVRKYSENIALLDVFYSLYLITKEYELKRPEIKENGSLKIEKGRHITAQKLIGDFIPMDFDFKNSKLSILTGTNGSGKSTLLKEIGTIMILSQAGSFTPAVSSEIPLIDKLFTVFNISDNLLNRKSSHQSQMLEISKITLSADEKSLVLIDEIGKNTSYKDGISLLFGILKYFLEKNKANVICSTHFFEIKKLLKEYEDKIAYIQINPNREINKGMIENSLGIESGKNENLPCEIIDYANSILNFIHQD